VLKTQAAFLHYYQLVLLLLTEDRQAFYYKALTEVKPGLATEKRKVH
jgi:hypothetical protein